MAVDDLEQLAAQYAERDDQDLINTVVANYELTDAIISTHPNIAQDAGFDFFDARWARRYWRTLASDVSGLHLQDKVQSWAVSSTISGIAGAIITTYGLPAVAASAAVALAVLLVRAARSENEANAVGGRSARAEYKRGAAKRDAAITGRIALAANVERALTTEPHTTGLGVGGAGEDTLAASSQPCQASRS